jgi:hypothetical protein
MWSVEQNPRRIDERSCLTRSLVPLELPLPGSPFALSCRAAILEYPCVYVRGLCVLGMCPSDVLYGAHPFPTRVSSNGLTAITTHSLSK